MRRAAVLVLVMACGSDEPARKPPAAPPKVAIDAAPAPVVVPPEVKDRYRLAAVRAEQTQPLPASPPHVVTLGYDGVIRRDDVVVEHASQLAADAPPPPRADGCTHAGGPPPTPFAIAIAARKDVAIAGRPIVLADRAASAYDLAGVLGALDGAALGVAGSADAASAFSLGFVRDSTIRDVDTSHSLYIYIQDGQLDMIVAGESYGGQFTTDGALDTPAFEANFGLARKGEGTGAIELLVAAETGVGLVVAVLDALAGAGVTELTVTVSAPGVSPGTSPGIGSGRTPMRSRLPQPPTIRLGKITVANPDHSPLVRRYVKRNIQKLQYCWERELPRDPEIAGPVKTTWIVRADGTTADVHVDGPDRAVDTCWRCVLQEIEFPRPKDGTPYDVRFDFTLVGD